MKEYKPSVLVDSSVVSYAASRPTFSDSRDVRKNKESSKQILRSWRKFNLFISWTVLDEISLGNPESSKKRIYLVKGIEVLDINPKIEALADDFMKADIFMPEEKNDALIVATSCFYNIDYLISCSMHLITEKARREDMIRLSKNHGYRPPPI
ncbi:MAG: type II toxin-antitoxin system VapC family toxin [Candidatus Portiera sp.]|nr:type II toxin-antitoxin system VapC family toxin [Portiera sp.]